MVMLNETEIKKDLFKSKAMAKFNHYIAGNLYYNVVIMGELYEFPISTVEDNIVDSLKSGLKLSEDLGTTRFESEIRGSELARWIIKAIKNETFIKLG
jgi:predicted methyltransferase MtxX (methanogen marker protein 4)